MTKICLGMACSDYIRTQTTWALIDLFKARPDMEFRYHQGPYVHQNRELVVEDFLKTDCTHLFFMDSDMHVKPEVLDTLLKADKDIIGAQYYRRLGNKLNVPVVKTRYDLEGASYPNHPFKQWPVATGCLLIKREVFTKVPKPWFTVGLAEAWIGEDVYFGRKAKEYGVEMWMEPSVKVGHIGEFVF